MKWIAISGSWRKMNKELEKQIREVVQEIITRGDGIVAGGALNVDYIATDEALKLNPAADKIKVILPTTLKLYAAHYRKRAKEGVITEHQAEELIGQLTKLKNTNSTSLVENKTNKVINKETYYQRNSAVIEASDELVAFHVNESSGTQDTIDKAKQKGIPVKVYKYKIE